LPIREYPWKNGADISFFLPVNSGSSSTFKVTHANDFDITYQDQSGAQGDYFTDVLSFSSSSTLKAQTMGIAYQSTLSPGLLGIGYDTNEASEGLSQAPFTYTSVIDSMVSQGLIGHKAYSLYLDDLDASTGSLLFGAIDSDKYQGDLVTLPIIAENLGGGNSIFDEFSVHFTGLGTSQSSTDKSKPISQDFDIPAVLDSGTTLTYVPTEVLQSLLSSVNGAVDSNSGFAFVDCALRDSTPGFTFDFTFGTSQTAVIKVPAAEMIYDADIFTGGAQIDVSISNPCAFGFMAQNGAPYVLGDNFLRSAYVVYDLKNNLIGIAQTNFDSTSSNIVDIASGATTIPNTKGVATSAVLEPTGTAGGSPASTGSSGTIPTQGSGNGLPTGTSSSSASGSTQGSGSGGSGGSGAGMIQPGLSGLAIMGVSVVFAALGGGLLLA
jgi:hypothetical protein